MIIKEFRLVLPINVEDYEIGHLYTVQKMSRIESTGAGSGIEIIENKPYEMENEKGQYTRKLYHVSERLPLALKTIANLVFPKSALIFEEECWNFFPNTRTKFNYKFSKSFSIQIESKLTSDIGDSENIFNLSSKELSARIIDYVDIVNDPVGADDYKEEEDPAKFVSKITNFGPLKPNWYEELKKNVDRKANESMLNNHKVKYMCLYKLCRVEFPIWGFQSKVEKLIVESIVRPLLLAAHRRGWCWQDEYNGMTLEDVRQLEKETEEYLRKKMKGEPVGEFKYTPPVKQQTSIVESVVVENNLNESNMNEFSDMCNNESDFGGSDEEDDDNEEENIDQFYDAISQASSLSDNLQENLNKKSVSFSSLNTIQADKPNKNSDNETIDKKLFRHRLKKKFQDFKDKNNSLNDQSNRRHSVISKHDTASSSRVSNVKNDVLILIVHGGNITCTDTSKQNDFSNFKSTMESVLRANYSQYNSRIVYRLVSCDSIVKESLLELSAISPLTADKSLSVDESVDFAQASVNIISNHENLQYNTLPLLALTNQNKYRENVKKFVLECNKVYQQFLSSSEGLLFQGQVVIIGDSLGSLLVYDSLTDLNIQNNSTSKTSDMTKEKLDFDVTHFFVFGSPLGLVLAQRKIASGLLDVPCCSHLYNLFHLTDPIAVRIEPLLSKSFKFIEPCTVPRYSKLPFGDGLNLSSYVVKIENLFDIRNRWSISDPLELNSLNQIEDGSQTKKHSTDKKIQVNKNWWGENRIDYVLYAPRKVSTLPKKSLPYVFHSCYWESADVAAFIIRMIFKFEHNFILTNEEGSNSANNKETWRIKFNRVNLRNKSENNKTIGGVKNKFNTWKSNFVSKDGVNFNRKSN